MLRILAVVMGMVLFGQDALSQTGFPAIGHDSRAGGDGSAMAKGNRNEVSSTVGEIDPGASIEGVTIINEKVWIDGKEIPPGVKSYKSPRTGEVYVIERRGRNISVTGKN